MVRNHPVSVRGGQVPDWEESQVLAALAVGFAVMGLFKQLMIFGKTGLQGLPTRVTLPLRAY